MTQVHRAFIDNKQKLDSEDPSDFTFYVTPAITDVSFVKVRSVSIPMTHFTFTGKSLAERTFTAARPSNGASINVVLEDTRNYTKSEYVQAINTALIASTLGLTVASQSHHGSALVFTSTDASSLSISNLPGMLASSITFPMAISSNATLQTGPVDLGSSMSKITYVGLPNLVNTSRSGIGHRGIVTSVLNQHTSSFGVYQTRTDDSGSVHVLNRSEVDHVRVQILDENFKRADVGDLPVFLELEFS